MDSNYSLVYDQAKCDHEHEILSRTKDHDAKLNQYAFDKMGTINTLADLAVVCNDQIKYSSDLKIMIIYHFDTSSQKIPMNWKRTDNLLKIYVYEPKDLRLLRALFSGSANIVGISIMFNPMVSSSAKLFRQFKLLNS